MKLALKTAALSAALAFAMGGAANAAELIANGDFESGYTGWTPGGQAMLNTAADYVICCGTVGTEPAYSTNHFISLGNDDKVGVHKVVQALSTVVGSLYTLSFDAGAFGSGLNQLDVSIGGVSNSYQLFANNNADDTFAKYTFDFIGTGADELSFSVVTVADSVDAILDNVSVQGLAVPEPSAWALMIVGFGAAGSALRRPRPHVA